MLIAQEKRKTNIAEYILYLWQVEDSIRACAFDPQTIEERLVRRFNAGRDEATKILNWYLNLAVMMEKEHVTAAGHVQAVVNLVNDLNEFHLKMLEVQNDPQYVALYLQNRVAITELAKKSGAGCANEIEVCLNALYGLMLLKLKKAAILETTSRTMEGMARMIGHLSARYLQFENDDFEF